MGAQYWLRSRSRGGGVVGVGAVGELNEAGIPVLVSVRFLHTMFSLKKKKKLHQLDGIPLCNYLRVSISVTQKKS